MRAAERERRDHVVDVARQQDADGYLAVVRCVVRVRGARAGVEADFALRFLAQGLLESPNVDHL